MGEITKTENHSIVAGGSGGLTSFFIPGEIDAAFRENEWAVAEMVEVLTNIVRCTDVKTINKKDGTVIEEPVTTARERMAAITMLDRKAKEAMVLGGLIQTDRLTLKKTAEDGTEAEYSVEGKRIAGDSSARLKSTLELLTAASHSQSDEIIDIVEEEETVDDTGNGSCDAATGIDGRISSGRPERGLRGSEPGDVGGEGSSELAPVHGEERTDSADPPGTEDNDQGTASGASNERGAGLPEQSGRSGEDEAVGDPGGQHRGGHPTDSVSPPQPNNECSTGTPVVRDLGVPDRGLPGGVPTRRPIIPGERGARRKEWWDAGIPRRSDDSDAGSLRDCETAESSVDRLKRIARAQEQATAASASYAKQRKKGNGASVDLNPGDEPGTSK